MANGEAAIKAATTPQAVAVAYSDYVASMTASGVTPKPLKDIVGK
jgi:hypothetical protein